MDGLQVNPWKRFGQDRLYVNLPDGRSAAWLDRRTNELNILLEVDRDAVLAALAPYQVDLPVPPAAIPSAPPAGTVLPPTGTTRPAAGPVLPPAGPVNTDRHPDDLAVHRPGAAIRAKIEELSPGFWRALADRLLRRRRPETESWRKGLVGEQMVGAELERLADSGWRVLHSIPLPREVDIDHLLIGPGGVFTVNTKYHRGGRIFVGDDSVKMGGQTYPYVRKARAEARRASEALSRACGFGVGAAGVLAFVEAEKLTVVASLRDVYVTHHDEIVDAFDGVAGMWAPADVERIYTAARHRGTWLNA